MSFFGDIFGNKPNYSNVKSPYQQVQGLVPTLPTMTTQAAGNIQNELQGVLSPDVINQIKNQGAAWGLNSGMPGSGAAGNVTLESLGLNSLQTQQKGNSDYLSFLSGVGSQQMPVSQQVLQANAAAAPVPWMAGVNNEVLGLAGAYLGGGGAGFGGASTGQSYQSQGGSSGGSSFYAGEPANFTTPSMSYDLGGSGSSAGSIGGYDTTFDASFFG